MNGCIEDQSAPNAAPAAEGEADARVDDAPNSGSEGPLGSSDAAIEELRAEVQALREELGELRDEAGKDKIIGQQLTRIAALEKSESTLRDARLATMMHYDLIAGIEVEYSGKALDAPAGPEGRWVLDLEVIRGDVETQLISLGLQLYQTSAEDIGAGTRLAFESQRAAKVEPTSNRDEDLIIVRSLRAGFRDLEGRPIRKEDVVAKRYHESS